VTFRRMSLEMLYELVRVDLLNVSE